MKKKKEVKKFITKKKTAAVAVKPLFPLIQFPSISRIIPATSRVLRIVRRDIWVLQGFITGLLLIGVIVSGMHLYQTYLTYKTVVKERNEVYKQLAYWQQVVKEHEGYRDGYIKLSALFYQIGDFIKAREYIAKALLLDPHNQVALSLAEKVGKEY